MAYEDLMFMDPAFFGEEDPMEPPTVAPMPIAPPSPINRPQAPPPQGFGARLKAALPGMLNAAIDAGATPNIAGGGAVDVLRAMQAARQGAMQRDLLGYNLQRQQAADMRDAEMRAAQRAQYEAAAARYNAMAGQKQAEPKSPAPVVVGGNLVDPSSGRVIFSAPSQATPSAARNNTVVINGKLIDAATGKVIYSDPAPPPAKVAGADAQRVQLWAQMAKAQAALGGREITDQEALMEGLKKFDQERNAQVARTNAATGASNASAGNSGASAAETTRKTTEGKQKSQIAKDADLAISQEASQDPERAAQNVLNPQFYQGWDEQRRASVAAEIKRRAQKKQGGRSSLLDRIGTGGGPSGPPAANPGNGGGTKKLIDMNIARQYLERAGGDKNKARQLAAADKWVF